MAEGPAAAGAHVVDVGDGHVVFDDRGGEKRLSASVTKLYTTATALLRLGQEARVSTRVLATGRRDGATWDGDLYLRGGGDFTFGTAAFARRAYGSRASVERLAARLRRSGLRRVRGSVLGDASLYSDNGGSAFDARALPRSAVRARLPVRSGRQPRAADPERSADPDRVRPRAPRRDGRSAAAPAGGLRRARADTRPARRRHQRRRAPGAAPTPAWARTLALTQSPTVARLAALINRPSDNYAADSMLRLVGARVAGDGSGAGGARVVAGTLARRFGLAPDIRTGSGETIEDRTSPRELVQLLIGMRTRAEGRAFARSLSLAGRNGTLLRFAGSVAENRCRLKDGTRVDPERPNTTLNISGYCTSVSGRTFAFAVMMNGMPLEFVPPDRIESPAYALQDRIVRALAGYRG